MAASNKNLFACLLHRGHRRLAIDALGKAVVDPQVWLAATVPMLIAGAAGLFDQPFLLALAGSVLTCLLLQARARRYLAELLGTGTCLHCGYDLRHASSSKCPECGAARNQGDAG